MFRFHAAVSAAAISLLLSVSPVAAASIVTIKVGYGAGGTFDMSSRLVARHLGRFLEGTPEVVVQNVPGGGSMKLTRLMLSSERADGSVLGSIGPSMAFAPILDPENADFDAGQIVWIGALSTEPAFCVTTKASGIDTLEKFISEEFLVGATGKAAQTYQFPAMIQRGLEANFRIVTGFDGAAEIELAMERGEVAAHCSATVNDLVHKGLGERFNVIGRIGSAVPDAYGDVPRFSDAITDPDIRAAAQLVEAARDVNYPLMVPPGTPEETVDSLRAAYAAMVQDAAFAADVEAAHEFTLSPTGGEEMAAYISRLLNADVKVLAAARELVR